MMSTLPIRFRILPVLALLLGLIALLMLGPRPAARPEARSIAALPALNPAPGDTAVADLHPQAAAVDDLSWLVTPAGAPDRQIPRLRSSLLAEKRLLAGDPAATARLNGVLAGEAFTRASRVVEHWLDHRDAESGL